LNTIESLSNDFKELGIKKGDTVFLRGDLGKVGRFENKKRSLFIESLLSIIGEEGTLVALGFTKSYPFYRVDKNYVFDSLTLPITGALGKLFLDFPGCQRSTHPISSFLAIGKNANYILEGHDDNSASYYPMSKIVNLNAKMILFGVIQSSPGFTTVHYAQEMLGLTKKTLFKGLYRVYYFKEGVKKLYIRKDAGGCSKGFSKFYPFYMHRGIMKLGNIGKSTAMAVPAIDAYDIEYKLLDRDPTYLFCDDISCLSCNITWTYHLKFAPYFFLSKIKQYIFKS
jgi:aminoglycoside N3'-acetyltransferase